MSRTVLIDVNLAYGYGRGIVEGVTQYTRPDKSWHVLLVPHNPATPEQTVNWGVDLGHHLDGVIAQIANAQQEAFYQQINLPVINISARRPVPLPTVIVDQSAIGRMAADHLLGLGLRHFAFVEAIGLDGDLSQRAQGFQDRIERAGHRCHFLPVTQTWKPGRFIERLGRWVARIPKPCGLMSVNDAYSTQLVTACRVRGIRVPEEVAIIGVDNDTLLCEHTNPPLSSVELPLAKIGFESAGLLDKVMAGEPVTHEPLLLMPAGIIARRSTDILAIKDPHVARMLSFIRKHACEGIRVDDAVAEVPVTRRWAEKRFRTLLGRSPAEEIRRVRIEHAETCLAQTDLSLPEIAFRCGFSTHTRFGIVFRKHTGLTPSAYRKQARPQSRA